MRVEVVSALGPAATQLTRVVVALQDGATVQEALNASGLLRPEFVGYAVYGERVTPTHVLRDGDRLELLRPLPLDPKQARRRRAQAQRGQRPA